MFDYLIVGAGFSGSALAERLASQGKKVCVADKRNHIGGNAYDHYDESGILVDKYDQCVGQALATFDRICQRSPESSLQAAE